MNCPHCGLKAINFLKWCRGSNGLAYNCPHCKTRLRANRKVWLAFGGAMICLGIYMGLTYFQFIQNNRQPGVLDKNVSFFIGVDAMVWAVIAWRFGGYAIARPGLD
jgi:hypothetical protein